MKKIIKKNNILIQEAIELVAEMFEYAKAHMHIEVSDFYLYFINSKISKEIYALNPIYVYGKSSIEIVKEILDICEYNYKIYDSEKLFLSSKEYWIGLVLASYCFAKQISFEDIIKYINIKDIEKMFNPMHEASHEKVINVIDDYIIKNGSNLARYRKNAGLSQSELSLLSGVSLRSIQLYEQRYKDINKANFDTILKLSNVLKIDPKELYECANVSNDNLVKMY